MKEEEKSYDGEVESNNNNNSNNNDDDETK